MGSRRLAKRSLAIAKANAQAGADAALTIAARTQNLLAPGGQPSDKAREARLMVQEKVDAAVEGALAAQKAWGAFAIRAAFGDVRTPNDVSAGLAAIAKAAAAPARRKVRANKPLARVYKLDELIVERIDLIKVDTEGHELAVLKGAQRTIEQFHPVLVLEVQSTLEHIQRAKLELWLREYGYSRFENAAREQWLWQRPTTGVLGDVFCFAS